MANISKHVGHLYMVNYKKATEDGALDGWEVTCTCGDVQTTSLSINIAYNLGDAHISWHVSQVKRGR